jgi:hypothetical protein
MGVEVGEAACPTKRMNERAMNEEALPFLSYRPTYLPAYLPAYLPTYTYLHIHMGYKEEEEDGRWASNACSVVDLGRAADQERFFFCV